MIKVRIRLEQVSNPNCLKAEYLEKDNIKNPHPVVKIPITRGGPQSLIVYLTAVSGELCFL